MRPALKISLGVVLVAALGGVTLWQQHRRDDAEATSAALAAASDAMAKLNVEDDRFPPAFTRAMTGLSTDLMFGTERAAATVKSVIVPMVDDYIVTIDRAVQLADAYLAREPDASVHAQLDKIRKRAVGFHAFRDKLRELQIKIDRGAPADEIASGLASAGWAMMLPDLTSK